MKDQERESNILTQMLSDGIPERDAFGGHEKVANAIYNLIQQEEKGGKAIALSGSYGSGKSTVIEFLKRKFDANKSKDKNETQVFVFDAWEHQGNSLRRAFIEKYVDFLVGNTNWSSNDDWEEELNKISKKVEEIETTSEPYVTTAGGILALLVLTLPLGLGIVNLSLKNDSLSSAITFFGYLFLLAPLIFFVILYLIRRPWLGKHRKKIKEDLKLPNRKFSGMAWFFWRFWVKHRPPHHKKSLFSVFVKETKEDVTSTSFKTPDPTTIEFQSVFDKITNFVLSRKPRRLIVVVDNIDRLTTNTSIDAWTTLRTFLEGDDKKREWKDQFWLIAPFDFQALRKVWGGLGHFRNEASLSSNSTSQYVQSFIDKTFQITFRVPKPVLSDWKTYFSNQLEKAFPNIDDDDLFTDVATLYQLKGLRGVESPTPRDVKQFINRIGAQYRIWHEEIGLKIIAYYELVVGLDPNSVVIRLQKDELVDVTSRSIINEAEINKKLAALHFNCEIDKAYQVLYGDDVASALQEGTSKDLEPYYQTDGFLDILNSQFYGLLGTAIPQSIANLALCLAEIEDKSEHNFKTHFYQLSQALKNSKDINTFNEKLGKGIVTIWGKTGSGKDWISTILEIISREKIDDNKTITQWFMLLKPILLKMSEKKVTSLLKDSLAIPGESSDYIKFLSLVNGLDSELRNDVAQHLRTNSESSDIVNTYSTFISNEEASTNLGETLFLQFLADEHINAGSWDWEDLLSQIKNLIRVNADTPVWQIHAALELVLILRFKFNLEKTNDLASDQNFRNGLFYLINNQNEEELLSLLILSSILLNPKSQKSGNDNNINRGFNTLNRFLENPEDQDVVNDNIFKFLTKFNLVEAFLKIQNENDELKSLPKYLIPNLFSDNEASNQISSDLVLEYFEDLYEILDKDIMETHILSLFQKEQDLLEKILESKDTIPSNFCLHYFFARACPQESQDEYFQFLIDGYKGLEKDEWFSHLKEESELIHLAIYIQDSGFDLGLSVKLKDALEDHYKGIYTDDISLPPKNLIDKWEILLNSLEDSVRIEFLKGIRYYIEGNSNGSIAKIGNLYDGILIEENIYLNDTSRFISSVFNRIIKEPNKPNLDWLKNLIESQSEILDKDQSATTAFKEEVKHLEIKKYQDDDEKDIIRDIAKALKVEILSDSNKEEEE